MKRFLLSLALVVLLAALSQAAPIGFFHVYDGPVWTSNPQVMSALDVAAMLFGGLPSDYAISVDPNVITHTAWVDGYGDTQYLVTPVAETFKLSSRLDGGYDQSPSYSAWVCDHADCVAYGAEVNGPLPGYNYTNYVFRSDVPEPSTFGLVGLALPAAFLLRRRARR